MLKHSGGILLLVVAFDFRRNAPKICSRNSLSTVEWRL